MPSSTGSVVNMKMLRTIRARSRSTGAVRAIHADIDTLTIKGKVNTAATLLMAVSEMDSATSPRARWVSRPELTPPGQATRIIRPTAMAGSSGNNWVSTNPSSRHQQQLTGQTDDQRHRTL
jgi:hypothetical protein